MLEQHSDDQGLKMIVKDFKQFLSDYNVSEINALNLPFDPKQMEAIEAVEGPEGIVIEVLQKGFEFKNKVIRPARVKVGNGQKEE